MFKNKRGQVEFSNFILLVIFLVVASVSGLVAGMIYYDMQVLDSVVHTINFPIPIENNGTCSSPSHICQTTCNTNNLGCTSACISTSITCDEACYSDKVACKASCDLLPSDQIELCYSTCDSNVPSCAQPCDTSKDTCVSVCSTTLSSCNSACPAPTSVCNSPVANGSLTDFQDIMDIVVYPILGLRTSLPYLVYFMIFGFIIALGMSAYMSSKNPIFFVLHILFTSVITYFSIILSGTYVTLLSDPFINNMMIPFTIYNKIMLYLPQIIFFTSLVFSVIAFVNLMKPTSNAQGNQTSLNYGGDY